MPAYSAPVTDMLYVLGELLSVESVLSELPGHADASLPLMGEVLREAARFCSEIVFPLNRLGDQEGCTLDNGVVRTPKGFPEAYAAFVASGWAGLSHDANHGGQGLPRALQVLFDEMLSSANFSFGLVTSLTCAAVKAISAHAGADLQAVYLPRMVSGEWTGAMALTEAHAGTDLGLLRSKAEAAADGSYRVTGTKMFITAADHDMAENIIHLVLARLPDAPPGIKGISLFLVPKYLPGKDAPVGLRNSVTTGSLEHKMGIKASPTCVMNYDGATGWLVGQPHRGLQAMFTMMNAERLFVGIQGLGIAEAAYQGASAYARERLQGRAPGVADGPTTRFHPSPPRRTPHVADDQGLYRRRQGASRVAGVGDGQGCAASRHIGAFGGGWTGGVAHARDQGSLHRHGIRERGAGPASTGRPWLHMRMGYGAARP